ncbi:MAG: proteasome accessory factor PafA2, partial [Corynebacterium sp.]|nr:proteasome accessory factor PafA2 [Corynebacterium sp.]
PEDSRAFFRGRMIERFPESITAANWESLIITTATGSEVRVLTTELGGLTGAEVGTILDTAADVDEVLEALRSRNLTELRQL